MSSQPEGKGGFVRAIGLFPATALNMSQMVRIEHTWPFGPKVIREQFLEEQQAEPVQAEHRNAA